MGFELAPVQGTVQELDSDLTAPPSHQREEEVIPVIKSAVADIVNAVGGYLSVSVNGNLNPASGEPGDIVHIYVTSLSAPVSPESPTAPVVEPPAEVQPPVETPTTPIGEEPARIEEAPIVETPVVETPVPPPAEVAPEVPVENPVTPESAPENTEIPPSTEPPAEIPVVAENPVPPVEEAPVPTEPVAETAPAEVAPEEVHVEGDIQVSPEN